MPSSQHDSSRRRHFPKSSSAERNSPGPQDVDAAPVLERGSVVTSDGRFKLSKVVGLTRKSIIAALPALIPWSTTFGLIFGGCCSNVFTLEKIVKKEPSSGLLITFVQFLVTALFTWPTHFSASNPPFFLRVRAVPLTRWLPNIVLFFTVNLLNNFAFSYNISVPVHIILRSGGSVTSMLVGFAWGKRYTTTQIFSVAMLTMGIITAAMADAHSKGKASTSGTKIDPSFLTGLFILALAQLLSAVMGLYTQLTYTIYGSQWHENLFYSHFLSLPLFLPFFPSLREEFNHFLLSPPISIFPIDYQPLLVSPGLTNSTTSTQPGHLGLLLTWPSIAIPRDILNLAANALTQYVCIRGVNLLSARTSALGVTIALNVRKLISLFLSIWLFGNRLPGGVLVGAAIVFGSAGIWAVEGQRTSSGIRRARMHGARSEK
ncbi:golgi uridine diphosphate-N- acetylglucosamine transporter [Lobaria immixta]|nr:golgi uridine diphosphate-N- acetylglucosamine transporter [Lobaria immixta]